MRVIAGTHRGRRLSAPKGNATRPTSDRVRENVFNLIGGVEDASVLDLFAGSGALGIEALSRGAATATFVEASRDACRAINANLDALGLRATVLCQDVVRALAPETRAFDLVLCDPPYDYDHGRFVAYLVRLVASDGVLVYESSGREPPLEVPGLAEVTSRKYGSARITLYRHP